MQLVHYVKGLQPFLFVACLHQELIRFIVQFELVLQKNHSPNFISKSRSIQHFCT